MCGRIEYVVTKKEILEDRYGAKLVEGYTDQGITPRYNVAPTAHTPIVMSENSEEINIGHWGFIPAWAAGKKMKEVINARAETVLQKPYFKSSIKNYRCLIPVTGFFEWKRGGAKKTPYRFHMDGDLFSLAGLYSNIKDENGNDMPHYAIITTSASALMEPVHDRMPVILEKKDEESWIEEGIDEHEIASFLQPFKSQSLKRDQISTLVNSVKNNSPEILNPVD